MPFLYSHFQTGHSAPNDEKCCPILKIIIKLIYRFKLSKVSKYQNSYLKIRAARWFPPRAFLLGSFTPLFSMGPAMQTQAQFHVTRIFSLGMDDPPKILKMRLAKGEITAEKYLELSKMISA